ncbi:oligosaccharide flippase family protein, partial [Crocosphaera chwakensis]
KLTLLQLGVQVITLTIMIVWAYFQRSIWALVVGNLISSLVNMIISHRLDSKVSNRFVWDKESIKEISSFGRWIFVSTAMTFLASQGDRLMLGKIFSLEMLGIYMIAFTLSSIPRQLMMSLNSSVIFPLISQKQQELEKKELRNRILNKRKYILFILGCCVTILFTSGDWIIFSLYDSRYHNAGWMLSILSLGIWPIVLHGTINPVLLALAKPYYVAFGNFLKVLYIIILVPLGYSFMKVLGVVIVIAANDIVPYLAVNYGLYKEGFPCLKQDFQATSILVIIIFLISLFRYYLGLGLPFDNVIS